MAGHHAEASIRVLTPADAEYPAALRTIFDPPSPVFVRGALAPTDEVAVAIVGTRRATPYGVAVAKQLASDLARCGVTVVSGMARGIDAAAHRGALDAGGRTIAVLGCGPDIAYPPEHRGLLEAIIGQGAVVSEYPPGTPPLAHQFPPRNRIISGLSRGVVVVEGRADSGALITADAALEQGREVFAVPGRVVDETSRAPHQLLGQGARLVERVEDILEELRLPLRPAPVVVAPELDATEATVLGQLSLTPQHVDRLAMHGGLPVAVVNRTLVGLECKGLAIALAGNRYVRRGASTPQRDDEIDRDGGSE